MIDLAIVGLRPKLKSIVHLGERRGDSYAIAFLPHAPFKDVGDRELMPHTAQIFVLTLELKGRRGSVRLISSEPEVAACSCCRNHRQHGYHRQLPEMASSRKPLLFGRGSLG